jgi:cysteine desulfurase
MQVAQGELMNGAVYLDNNATTRVDPRVVAAMLPFFSEQFGNASSQHSFGNPAADAVRVARRQVQELVGAAFDHEIVFTSGGTESDNAAILSALETQTGRDEVITSQVEHPAVLALCEFLEKRRGVKVHRLPVDHRGRLDIDAYRRALSPKTAIVSLMWANNETGTLFPVAELAALAHDCGALFHTDAVQAAGKVTMKLKDTAIDMASFSAHKIHGPKGIGAIYVRKGVRLAPLVRGGRQERGRRAGTENTPAIVGFGKAAELAASWIEELPRVQALRDRLQHALLASMEGAFVIGDAEHRLPNTLNMAFEYLESEAILQLLDRQGIAASSGSACAAGSMEPSHVLRAMKAPYTVAHGAVRFSFSRENTSEDVDRAIAAMKSTVERLRTIPPAQIAAVPALDSSYA